MQRTAPVGDSERYRLLIEYAPDGIFVVDDEGNYVDVNPAGCDLLGYTRDEILRMHVTDIIVEDERAEAMRTYRVMSVTHPTRVERCLRRKDGSTIRAAIHAWVTPDGYRQSIIRDISRRVLAEEALRQSEALLRTVVTNVPVVLAAASRDGIFTLSEGKGLQTLGLKPGEAVGLSIWDMYPDNPDNVEAARRVLAGESFVTTVRLGDVVFESHYAPILDSSGEVDGAIAVGIDVTERERALEAERASRDYLSTVLSSLGVILNAVDNEGIFTLSEGGGLAAANLEPGQLVGTSFREYNRDHPEALEGLQRALAGEPNTVTYRSGETHVESHFAPVRNAAGEVAGATIVRVDVTERERAVEAGRKSEEHLKTVVSNIPVVLAAVDRDGVFTLSEGRGLEAVGLKPGEAVGRSIWETDAANPESVEAARRVLAGESFVTAVHAGAFVFESHYAPILNSSGEIDGAIGVGIDVTERERAFEARRQSEQYLRTVLSSAPMLFGVLDRNGTFIESEGKLLSAFGMEPGQSVGTSVWERYRNHPQLLDAVRRALGGEPATANFNIAGIEIQSHFVPALDGNGEVDGAIGIGFDVSERKRMEMQLVQAQKMEAVGRLAGGVAHDVNNLMTAIMFNTDLALQSVGTQHAAAVDLKETRAIAERAGQMAHQLLAFSRREMIEPRELHLNDLVARTERMLRRLIGEDIDLVTRLSPGLCTVRVDPTQFEQLLINLAVNARDAMPTGGRLMIETEHRAVDRAAARRAGNLSPGDYVCLSVSDTGEGISDEVREHLFEPFYTTKDVGQGTGLGLAACYGIVKQAGGGIVVESAPGEGATFSIYVPCLGDAEADRALDDASVLAELPRGTETILLVEDEDSVRRPAARVLSRLGYAVTEAADGLEALRIASEHPEGFDLLVTDVVMPGMSGKQIADRLVSGWPEMRVLFTSGYIDDAIVRHGVDARGLPFLRKPFTPDVLARTVRDLLGAGSG